jgi:hypothetical protein
MWRPVAFVLIAANVLFFAWALMIAPPADRSAGDAAPAAGPPAADPGVPPQDRVAAPPAPRCVSLGPFGDPAVAATVSQRLIAAGLSPVSRAQTQQHRDGYWVVVETTGQAQQRAVLAQIRRAGIQDAYAMPDDAKFRISLGIYSDRGRAEQRLATLRPLNLEPRVEEHFQERAVQWLDVPGAGDRLSASQLEGFGIADNEVGAFDCPAPAAP